jgi:hypothetical protein
MCLRFALMGARIVGSQTVSRRHGAPAPFFNSAGQLTITVSGCANHLGTP